MPIYVFRCDDCGEKFERLQKLSDPDPDACPNCGKHDTVRRQVTAPAFRLAGSGWYETDFKSGGKKNVTTGGESAASESSTPASAASSESASSATVAAPAAGHGNGCACH